MKLQDYKISLNLGKDRNVLYSITINIMEWKLISRFKWPIDKRNNNKFEYH